MKSASLVAAVFVFVALRSADGATLTTVADFDRADGWQPWGDLISDSSGALYGTAQTGGAYAGKGGVVFEIPSSGGVTVLQSFTAGSNGEEPSGGVIMDASGALYGEAYSGGTVNTTCPSGCGVVFKLTPAGSGWTETVLWSFQGGADGATPLGGLIRETSGALYGVTRDQGAFGQGAVFKLTPPEPGHSQWTKSTLWSFTGGRDGAAPYARLLNKGRSLYGTAQFGGLAGCLGTGCGTVFKLTAPALGQTQWTEATLYEFTGGSDCGIPLAGLMIDKSGALYGTTFGTLPGQVQFPCYGTVFKLSRPRRGQTQWTETELWAFGSGDDGFAPLGGVIGDPAVGLFGTTLLGGGSSSCLFGDIQSCGTVFELTPPTMAKGPWGENILHQFDFTDGANPFSGLLNIGGSYYGVTVAGGIAPPPNDCFGGPCGTVFQLTP